MGSSGRKKNEPFPGPKKKQSWTKVHENNMGILTGPWSTAGTLGTICLRLVRPGLFKVVFEI